jgi:hypothetical protein
MHRDRSLALLVSSYKDRAVFSLSNRSSPHEPH